ncbi:MAG: NAD kinase [Candidatus Nucleicultricaceae bacterium]
MIEQEQRPLKIAFLGDATPEADRTLKKILKHYAAHPVSDADVVVVLGGDGFLLKVLHHNEHNDKPVYGINCGSVGFLMNAAIEDALEEKIKNARSVTLFPLHMRAYLADGTQFESYTINEVYIYRETYQAAKLKIFIDDVERLPELTCDGIILATPAGSTAYNLSAHGPIIPLEANLLALTPISAFRPRQWRGALLPSTSRLRVEVLDANKRPVSAVAGSSEFKHIVAMDVAQSTTRSYRLLYDGDHALEERIIREQFAV